MTDIREGDVYVAREANKMRRVLGVLQEKVVYSRGGDGNGICSIKWFCQWCEKQNAKLIHRAKKEKTCKRSR